MILSISEFLVKLIKKTGVDTVWGIPSYVGMHLLQNMHEEGFNMILNSHEENAAYAAGGYYYATGKPGVVSRARGPGLTNAITGIAEAYIESIPRIVISGRPSTRRIGRNEYHANSGLGRTLDEALLIKSCSKNNYIIDSKISAVGLIQDAVRTALTGRPGPVYISIPAEIQKEEIEIDEIPEISDFCGVSDNHPSNEQLVTFKKLVETSQKPIFIFGREVSQECTTVLDN